MYPPIVHIFNDPEVPRAITMCVSVAQELSSDDMFNDIPIHFPEGEDRFGWVTPNIETAVEKYLLKTNDYEM